MKLNSRTAGVAFALMVPMACDSERGAVSVLVRDSAGVEIVDNYAPAWSNEEEWRVVNAPEVVIGADGSDPAQQLFVVYHAVLQDSIVIVANNGTSELRMFNMAGETVAVVGGRGDGPGEFNGLRGVHACQDGRLLAVELRRISILTSAGEFVRAVRLAPDLIPTPGNVVGAPRDCSAVIVERGEATELSSTNAVYSQTALLSRVPLDGGVVATIARIAGPDLVNVPSGDRNVPQRLPWGRSPVYAVGANEVFVGSSDTSEVQIYGQGGLQRIIRWPAERKPVGDRDRSLFAEQQAAEIREDGGRLAQLLPSLEGYPHVPGRKPSYARLVWDPSGYLWVREYQDVVGWLRSGWELDQDGDPETWWIFDSKGRWLGSVAVPARLRILGIQNDLLFAIALDANDVERLQLHRIERGRAEAN